MKKGTRILIYSICVAIVFWLVAFLFMKYVLGIKGMYNRFGQYITFEGFQSSPYFTDAYVITLDKYPERLPRIKENAEEAGMKLIPWQGVIIKEDDLPSLPQKGIGSILFQDRSETRFNFGVIGCFLAHRGLLEHISKNPNGLGTFICEDDIIIPNDFYTRFAAVTSDIPDDWDIIFMRKFVIKAKPVTSKIKKLEKDITSSKNMGMWGFIVKNTSIKTKILPVLEQMTDAIDFQLGRHANSINMYLVDPPIIDFHESHDDSIIKKMDEENKYVL
jgi:GR25 family glycosyltransferase involved in LPS biosynthesis